jgi:hypothetical protein
MGLPPSPYATASFSHARRPASTPRGRARVEVGLSDLVDQSSSADAEAFGGARAVAAAGGRRSTSASKARDGVRAPSMVVTIVVGASRLAPMS